MPHTDRVQVRAPRRGRIGVRDSTTVGAATQRGESAAQRFSRKAQSQTLTAKTALAASVEQPPLNDDEIRALIGSVGQEEFRVRAGLPPGTDMDALLSNPSLAVAALNESAPDRAREQFEEKDEQSWFERNLPFTRKVLGFVGPKVLENVPTPSFDFDRKDKVLLPGTEALPGILGALDVFTESLFETGAQVKKLVKSDFGEIEAPTVFAQGPKAALQQFEDRPFHEQLLMSLADPAIFKGVVVGGVRAATGRVGAIAAKDVAKEAVEVAAREEMRRTAKRVPVLSEPTRTLERIKPKRVGAKFFGREVEAPAFVRKLFDRSGEIHRMPIGSEERQIADASAQRNLWEVEADGQVEIMMNEARSINENVDELFGLPKNRLDLPEPRASQVTHTADGTAIDPPLLSDVIERSDSYRLTGPQRAWAEKIREPFPEFLEMFKAEGMEVAEFGKGDDAFHFFSRKVIDEATGKSKAAMTRKGSSFTKHRVAAEAETVALNKGTSYAPWEVSLEAYYRAAYKAIISKRYNDASRPIARPQIANRRTLKAARDATKLVADQTTSITDVKRAVREFIPSASTVQAMMRRFPNLAPRIEAVFKLKPTEIDEIIRAALPGNASNDLVEKFRAAMIEHINGRPAARPTARLPKNLPTQDVKTVVKKLGLDAKESAQVLRNTLRQTEKLYQGARKAELDALLVRMEDVKVGTVKAKNIVVKQATLAKERARSPRSGETRGPGDLSEQIFSKETAARIEKTMLDNGTKAWKIPSKVTGVLRQVRTTFDVGTLMVQGLPLLFRDPAMWGQVAEASIKSLFDPRIRARYIANNATDLTELIQHGGLLGSEFTEALTDGGWLARLPTNISNSRAPSALATPVAGGAKVINVTTQRFGTSFNTMLDLGRVEMWKSLKPLAKTQDDLDDIATFVNHMTGVMSPKALGIPLSQQEFESSVMFFSPRFTRATAALFADVFRGGIRGDQARRTLGQLFLGGMAMHSAIAMSLDQKPNLNPLDRGKFLRVNIGGEMVGFVPKPFSFVKIIGGVAESALTSPNDFIHINLFSSDDIAQNPILQGIGNQMAPGLATGITIVRGSSPIGEVVPGLDEPIDAFKYFGQESFPFWMSAMMESEGEGAAISGAAEFLGGSAFPVKPYVRVNELLDKYAQADYGVSWEELQEGPFGGKSERRSMILAHDDLRAMQELSNEEQLSQVRSKDKREALNELSEIRSTWLDGTSVAGDEFIRDAMAGTPQASLKFRRSVGAAGDKAKGGRETLERLPKYANVFSDLDDVYDDLAETDPLQAATQEFFDRLGTSVNKFTGKIDYDAVDRLREEIDYVYGDGTMAQLDEAQRERRTQYLEGPLHPIVAEFYASVETLKPYWNAYKLVVPEQFQDRWRLFELAREDQKDLFRATGDIPYTQLEAQIEAQRLQIKTISPEIDLALLRFYGYTPSNRENMLKLEANYRKLVQSGR